jgi:hypothetical protein
MEEDKQQTSEGKAFPRRQASFRSNVDVKSYVNRIFLLDHLASRSEAICEWTPATPKCNCLCSITPISYHYDCRRMRYDSLACSSPCHTRTGAVPLPRPHYYETRQPVTRQSCTVLCERLCLVAQSGGPSISNNHLSDPTGQSSAGWLSVSEALMPRILSIYGQSIMS